MSRVSCPNQCCGGKARKSLVLWSSFPHGWIGRGKKNDLFVKRGLPSRKVGDYNPPIAEERGARRRRAWRQASEIKCKFAFQVFEFRLRSKNENGVLTDENVSNTTRQR